MSVKPMYIEPNLLLSEKELEVLQNTLADLLKNEIPHEETVAHFHEKFPLMKDLLELLPAHAKEEAMRITRQAMERQVAEARKRVAAMLTKLAVLRVESDHVRSGEPASIVRFVFPNQVMAEEFLAFFQVSTQHEYEATAEAARQEGDGSRYVKEFHFDVKTLTVTGKNS